MKRLALLLALPLLGAPALPSAAAVAPGSVEVALVRVQGSCATQLFDAPSGPRSEHVDCGSVEVSADGTRTVSTTFDGVENAIVTVRDIGGHVVGRKMFAPDDNGSGGVLSPNGRHLASTGGFSFTPSAYAGVDDLATGQRRTYPLAFRAGGVVGFVTDDLLIVQEGTRDTDPSPLRLKVLSLSGAPDRTISGYAGGLFDRTGSRVVVTGAGGSVSVRPVRIGATSVTFGTPRLLATGASSPAFSADGTRVVFVRGGDLWSVPAGGGTPTRFGPATTDVETAVAIGLRDTVVPGAPTFGRAILAGTRATLPFTTPADASLSRLLVTRTSPGLPAAKREVGLPSSSFIDSDLEIGRAYTYSARVVDRSGNTGPAGTTQLVATSVPSIGPDNPTTLRTTAAQIPVLVSPRHFGEAPDTTYDVDVRSTGGWVRWQTGTDGLLRIAYPGVPGQSYDFRGIARDRFGNTTALKVSGLATIPYDDQRATYTGSTVRPSRLGSYGGRATFLSARGATATIRLAGDQLRIIGERCPTCGEFEVLVDGRSLGRVSSSSEGSPFGRQQRVVLWSHTFGSGPVRTLTVRALSPTVVLDGFSGRRFVPPATLATGKQLLTGQGLTSVNRAHRLLLQRDGNLVLSTAAGTPVWASRTAGAVRAANQEDGNLVLSSRTGTPLFQTRSAGNGPSVLVLQDDGNLVLYRSRDGRALWSSRSGPIPSDLGARTIF